MRTGLYCYWGAVGDHTLNIPGHPLYQLYFLEVLQKAFQLDKIYFYSFLKNAPEKNVGEVVCYVLEAPRKALLQTTRLEILTLGEAIEKIPEVDCVFLKARFRNRSRLAERSYDALKFETLLRLSPPEKTYVIDSDGELPLDFFARTSAALVTFFLDHGFYDRYAPKPTSIITLPPALCQSFVEPDCSQPRNYDLFFIGNEGLKQPKLAGWLSELSSVAKVGVQGKWSTGYHFDLFQRTQRDRAYNGFISALTTLQLSKEKYRQYTFLSPRIYEAMIASVVPLIEAGYACASDFCSIHSYIDLREKVLTLREGYGRDFVPVYQDARNLLESLEKTLLQQDLLQRPRVPVVNRKCR